MIVMLKNVKSHHWIPVLFLLHRFTRRLSVFQSADATSYFVILENYKKESLNKELQQNRCCIQALLAAMAQNHAEQGL